MKASARLVIAIIGAEMIFSACSNDVSPVDNLTKFEGKQGGSIVSLYGRQMDSIGLYHYIAVDTAVLTSFTGSATWQDSVTQITRRGMSGLKNMLNWDTTGTIKHEQSDSINAVGSVAFPGSITSFADLKLRVSGYTGWSGNVTSQDRDFIDSVALFFSKYSTAGKSRAQVYSDLIGKASSLITYFNSLTWTGTSAGELAAGVIQTLKQRAVLWDTKSGNLQPGDPRLEPPFAVTIVQLDALLPSISIDL